MNDDIYYQATDDMMIPILCIAGVFLLAALMNLLLLRLYHWQVRR